jgi:hypothetical protein
LEFSGMGVDDIEGLAPDGPGRAQYGNTLHVVTIL